MNFDPEKSLFNLNATRWTFVISLLLAAATTGIIYWNSQLYIDPTFVGFNKAIDIFKVPLATLAVGLSLIGIFGANHRSEQTKKQIERTATQIDLSTRQIALTMSQNNFTNYYKHIEEFDKYCKHFDDRFSISPRSLYIKIFPESRKGTYTTSPNFIANFRGFAIAFIDLGCTLDTSDYGDYEDGLFKILQLRNAFMAELKMKDNTYVGAGLTRGQESITVPERSALGAFKFVIELCNRIDEILQFDLEYVTPEEVKKISKIDLEAVPAWAIGGTFEPVPMMSLLSGTARKWTKPRRHLDLSSHRQDNNSGSS